MSTGNEEMRADPVETRGPEISESVYEKAAKAIHAHKGINPRDPQSEWDLLTGVGKEPCRSVARVAVDAAVAELGLTVERWRFDFQREERIDTLGRVTPKPTPTHRRYISPWTKEPSDA